MNPVTTEISQTLFDALLDSGLFVASGTNEGGTSWQSEDTREVIFFEGPRCYLITYEEPAFDC